MLGECCDVFRQRARVGPTGVFLSPRGRLLEDIDVDIGVAPLGPTESTIFLRLSTEKEADSLEKGCWVSRAELVAFRMVALCCLGVRQTSRRLELPKPNGQ